MLKNHGTFHSCVQMLPVKILVNPCLLFKVSFWIPVFWEAEFLGQVSQNGNAANTVKNLIKYLRTKMRQIQLRI